MGEILNAKIKGNRIVGKLDISGLTDIFDLEKKIETLAAKAEFKAKKDKIVRLQAFDSSYLLIKSHFEDDGTQSQLILQLVYLHFKKTVNNKYISTWKFNGLMMKFLNLLQDLMKVLLQWEVILILYYEQNLMEVF